MDITQLPYTVTKFDQTRKTVEVEFGDGGRAQVQLTQPFPANQAELEARIRDFAPSVETLQAHDTAVDLTFIDALVGVQQIGTRRTVTVVIPTATGAQPTAADKVKSQRDSLLASTNHFLFPDMIGRISPKEKAALFDYRKALFEIENQSGFPDSVVWPTPPGMPATVIATLP